MESSNGESERNGDLGEENWTKFVCVEAGSVTKPVELKAREKWEGVQGIKQR